MQTDMQKTATETVNDYYEEVMFGSGTEWGSLGTIGFYNVGYWKGIPGDNLEVAQINLIETLIEFFPDRQGNILDVACGKGASSRYLTKYFEASNIIGINISEKQLAICKTVAPRCNFRLMDATQLDFSDSSIDNILCIEAALHFMTRAKFFEEAYRVLKTGGRLAMSDVLVEKTLAETEPVYFAENYLPSIDSYRESLLSAGFKYARVEDSTKFSIEGLLNVETKRREKEFYINRDYKSLEEISKRGGFVAWCMAYAIK